MRVIISAGGTGGHIYPALAILNKIKEKEPNSEFLYIGTHNRMEKDIVPLRGIPYESIEIYGFSKNLFKNFKTVGCVLKSYKKCKKLIREFNPDVVIGVGGYVTSPVIFAAKKLGYKTVIHEQNSFPGKSNQFLSKYSDLICVSFKSTIKSFPTYKTVLTGNPCSEDALNKPMISKSKYGLSKDKKLVLIVMGSLGSSRINDFIINSMNLFENRDYEVLFVTGKASYDEVIKNKFPDNVHVVPYVDGMTGLMKNTDLIVSRAGASTISEIVALGIPSILIPSPYVANNHQFKNALDLVDVGGAHMIEEKNLEGDILVKEIDNILNSDEEINNIKKNLKSLSVDNSASLIYDSIKELVDRK
jgi:UDP-N-acetylglucosamine--N-acetylmuramyl-(pentapeptide) pyrophosphoryl-undecaprenol N-acetylglucosamine transferase